LRESLVVEMLALPTSLMGWCGCTWGVWCGCGVGVPEGVCARGMSDGDAVLLMVSLGTVRLPGVRRVAAIAQKTEKGLVADAAQRQCREKKRGRR
jgi:hypothetical protein